MTNALDKSLLFVSTNLGIGGGAEQQVIDLALGLHSRQWRVGIVSMLRPEGPLPPELETSGIAIRSLNMPRGVPDPRAIPRLAAMVKQFRPSVLHSHMTHANILARLVRPFAPVPVLISTLHGIKMYGVNKKSTRWRELAHRFTDRWADLTTTICRAGAESYLQSQAVPPAKLLVVGNAIETRRFAPNATQREKLRRLMQLEGKFVWLTAGRLERVKNQQSLLRAFALDCETNADSRLLICGAGTLDAELRALAKELGIAEKVHFLGFRRDLADLQNAADAFVLSSNTEGLPMVLLQAAAGGLPVLATAVGGNPEIVEPGETGFLTPAGDVEMLARRMHDLTALPAELRHKMGLAGRKRVAEFFDIGRILDRWEFIYRSLLDSGAVRPHAISPAEIILRN